MNLLEAHTRERNAASIERVDSFRKELGSRILNLAKTGLKGELDQWIQHAESVGKSCMGDVDLLFNKLSDQSECKFLALKGRELLIKIKELNLEKYSQEDVKNAIYFILAFNTALNDIYKHNGKILYSLH